MKPAEVAKALKKTKEVEKIEVKVLLLFQQTTSSVTSCLQCEQVLAGASSGEAVTFASIHPSYSTSGGTIDSAELQLARFIPGVVELAGAAEAAEKLPTTLPGSC